MTTTRLLPALLPHQRPRAHTGATAFLVTAADTDAPQLHLVDGDRFASAHDLATRALGLDLSPAAFDAVSCFRDDRRLLAGAIAPHHAYVASDGTRGLYTIELWPGDAVGARLLARVFHDVVAAVPVVAGRLAYHAVGVTQEARLREDAAELATAGVRTITTEALRDGLTYAPVQEGVAVGVLRVVDEAAPPPTASDIVVLARTPGELGPVAGIIATEPCTPLSPLAMQARRHATPCAYVAGAATPAELTALRDRLVRLELTAGALHVRAATPAEHAAFLATRRRPVAAALARDLSRTEPVPLGELRAGDARTYGATAAGLGELRRALTPALVPDGWALPFAVHDRFMRALGLDDAVRAMLAAPGFAEDTGVRAVALARLRARIVESEMPPALAVPIADIYGRLLAAHGPFQPVRFRASTNVDDRPGWLGDDAASTLAADEGEPARAVQRVFASLWTFRAFEERAWHGVDHLAVATGVIVEPVDAAERARGRACTRNLYDPRWPGCCIRAQARGTAPGARAEELLIARSGAHGALEAQYVSRSSLVPSGVAILDEDVLERLVAVMELVHAHVAPLHGRSGDATFALELDFALRADRSLQIERARPLPH